MTILVLIIIKQHIYITWFLLDITWYLSNSFVLWLSKRKCFVFISLSSSVASSLQMCLSHFEAIHCSQQHSFFVLPYQFDLSVSPSDVFSCLHYRHQILYGYLKCNFILSWFVFVWKLPTLPSNSFLNKLMQSIFSTSHTTTKSNTISSIIYKKYLEIRMFKKSYIKWWQRLKTTQKYNKKKAIIQTVIV